MNRKNPIAVATHIYEREQQIIAGFRRMSEARMKEQKNSIEQAAKRLEQAQNAVCDTARDLKAGPTVDGPTLPVSAAGWIDLQHALKEWRNATEAFLREAKS